MFLLAELQDVAQWASIASSVLFMVIAPWVITVERRLATLIAQGANGNHKELENLRKEVYSQRKEYGKRIHDMEIKLARLEGPKSGDSGIGIS